MPRIYRTILKSESIAPSNPYHAVETSLQGLCRELPASKSPNQRPNEENIDGIN